MKEKKGSKQKKKVGLKFHTAHLNSPLCFKDFRSFSFLLTRSLLHTRTQNYLQIGPTFDRIQNAGIPCFSLFFCGEQRWV